jgi:hypothetical protein
MRLTINCCSIFALSMALNSTLFAQGVRNTTSKGKASPRSSISCTDQRSFKACGTFKQLLDARDRDIEAITREELAYVCFHSDEDEFVVVTPELPKERFIILPPDGRKVSTSWFMNRTTGLEEQPGSVSFFEYKDGIQSSSEIVLGLWTRRDASDTTFLAFRSSSSDLDRQRASSWINEAEVNFSVEYPSTPVLQYKLSIRRSTGRYADSLSFKDDPSAARDSGQCLIFSNQLQ